jgi:hypothetical protein
MTHKGFSLELLIIHEISIATIALRSRVFSLAAVASKLVAEH